MNAPKVKLSTNELDLVTDSHFILTKNGIISKVYTLFGNCSEAYKQIVATTNNLPVELTSTNAKIARGENYEGLPWVMLDYPRYFNKEDIFTIRTFFWWGNFISITLQLHGRHQQQYESVVTRLTDASPYPWQLSINKNAWQHHFREDNYQPLSSVSEATIANLHFLKLAKKIPLQEWDNIDELLNAIFLELITALA